MESKRVEEDYKALVASNSWAAVYQSITRRCHSYQYTCVEAKKAENKPLNRYRDVNPYDHSRIVLRREGFDYINANLVKVERANRQYILTQGPLVYTSGHFWLMIWEQNCPAIIMLNKVIENLESKCHWYWPHEDEEKTEKEMPYPDVNMTISQVSELDCNYYTIRKLRVTNHDTEESRDIWQFHYTTWPDFGVPESPHAFLVFLKHVNEYHALDGTEGPAVVHCSAGIGRSGTFCLVDSVLVLIENEGQANVDVQEILLEMRRYRMGLIQTSEQFRFSYKAIIEGIKRMDPNYEPNSDVVPEPEPVRPRQEEEAPPPPPPRGESLGTPPARPLPAIPVSASMGLPLMPLNATPHLERSLFIRRRERALNIAASGLNISSQQSNGLPTLAALAATSAGIEPRAVPMSTLPPLSLIAANVVLTYPVDEFGNPLPVSDQMETFEDSPTATLQETSDTLREDENSDPPTATLRGELESLSVDGNSDSLPSPTFGDNLPLNSGAELTYISSEDMRTYEVSSEYETVDMTEEPPANLDREGLNLIELSSIDSDASDAPPTPPPRPRVVSPRQAQPETPTAGSSYEELEEDDDNDEDSESVDSSAEGEVGAGEGAGLRRRRRDAALAERIAEMKKRSRDADRWNTVKRSFLQPLAISIGLLAVLGVIIYACTHKR